MIKSVAASVQIHHFDSAKHKFAGSHIYIIIRILKQNKNLY